LGVCDYNEQTRLRQLLDGVAVVAREQEELAVEMYIGTMKGEDKIRAST
jgi:hypothetical protein